MFAEDAWWSLFLACPWRTLFALCRCHFTTFVTYLALNLTAGFTRISLTSASFRSDDAVNVRRWSGHSGAFPSLQLTMFYRRPQDRTSSHSQATSLQALEHDLKTFLKRHQNTLSSIELHECTLIESGKWSRVLTWIKDNIQLEQIIVRTLRREPSDYEAFVVPIHLARPQDIPLTRRIARGGTASVQTCLEELIIHLQSESD